MLGAAWRAGVWCMVARPFPSPLTLLCPPSAHTIKKANRCSTAQQHTSNRCSIAQQHTSNRCSTAQQQKASMCSAAQRQRQPPTFCILHQQDPLAAHKGHPVKGDDVLVAQRVQALGLLQGGAAGGWVEGAGGWAGGLREGGAIARCRVVPAEVCASVAHPGRAGGAGSARHGAAQRTQRGARLLTVKKTSCWPAPPPASSTSLAAATSPRYMTLYTLALQAEGRGGEGGNL